MTEGHDASTRRWCILRTAAPRTLLLADALEAAGYEAWTPRETIERRRPRSRAKDKRVAPILPTFVFASAVRLADLLLAQRSTMGPLPPFSVFMHRGRVALIHPNNLDTLRAAERAAERREKKGQRRFIAVGSEIIYREGPFAGLTGIVDQSDGKKALVTFNGTFQVTIETFLLPDDVLAKPRPHLDIAA